MLVGLRPERHEKTNTKHHGKVLHWRPKYLIEMGYQAATNPKGQNMADDACRTAVETKQDPDHPDDEDWKLYLIKKEVTQAEGDTETHSTAVTVAGEVTDTKAAEALMAEMAKIGKAKAKAKGKAKPKAADANLPGLPVPGSVDGKPQTPLAKKINVFRVEWAVQSTRKAHQEQR